MTAADVQLVPVAVKRFSLRLLTKMPNVDFMQMNHNGKRKVLTHLLGQKVYI
jgi:hypothetical protein